jgi:hypothetical protein
MEEKRNEREGNVLKLGVQKSFPFLFCDSERDFLNILPA